MTIIRLQETIETLIRQGRGNYTLVDNVGDIISGENMKIKDDKNKEEIL